MAPREVVLPETRPTATTHGEREKPPEVPANCIHCYGSGCIYEATEDASCECHLCLGTGRKMSRDERKMLRSDLRRPRL